MPVEEKEKGVQVWGTTYAKPRASELAVNSPGRSLSQQAFPSEVLTLYASDPFGIW